jgi:16S rRNA (guanine966-N2)-methyltransferase
MHIIAGTYKNQRIIAPKGEATRPTSSQLREAVFNICQTYIEGARFLDLFAGSGAMGLEALSRGAITADFVDNSKDCIQCIKQNIRQLKLESQAQVIYGEVFDQMAKLLRQRHSYDIIYADPPYAILVKDETPPITASQQVVRMIDKGGLLAPSGVLFVEEAKGIFLEFENLQTLVLKKARRMGRSVLHQYQNKESTDE